MEFVRSLRQLVRHRLFRRLLAVRVATQTADGVLQVALASFVLFSPQRQPDAASVATVLAITLAAVLDPRAVRRRRAGSLVATADPGRPRPGPCRAGRRARGAGRLGHPDRLVRRRVLRRRAGGDEPQPVPAGRVVGGAAAHHRRVGVHGRQLRDAHHRAARHGGRRRPGHDPAGGAREPDARLPGERGAVLPGRDRLADQHGAGPADPAPGARPGRAGPGPRPRHRPRAGRGAQPPEAPPRRGSGADRDRTAPGGLRRRDGGDDPGLPQLPERAHRREPGPGRPRASWPS